MRRLLRITTCLALAACASSGVNPTGADTYMLTTTSAGGAFVSGAAAKATCTSRLTNSAPTRVNVSVPPSAPNGRQAVVERLG